MNINKDYSVNESVTVQCSHFCNAGILWLPTFLEQDTLFLLEKSLKGAEWEKQCIPDRYSYGKCTTNVIQDVFSTSAFTKYASGVIGNDVKLGKLSVRRFAHGDYTLLHDAEQQTHTGTARFYYFLFDTSIVEWNPAWGGQLVFPQEGDAQIIVPDHNGLCFVQTNEDTLSFVKYVNCLAEQNSFILIEGELV